MEIKQLKYFIQIAKDLNYTTASKNLYVTQPTLSWTIKKLEEELGVKLFDYDGKKLTLTSMGEELLIQAKHLVKEYQKTIDLIQSHNNTLRGKIKLGIPDLFADCFFIDPIMNFMSRYPKTSINMVHNGSLAIQKMVETEEIDIGIISHLHSDIQLEVIELPNYTYKEILIVSDNHPLANKCSVSLSDLKNEPLILLTEEFTLGKLPVFQCMDAGFTPKVALRSSEWSVICDAVAHSNYVSFLPCPLVTKYIKEGGITIIPIDHPHSNIPISIVTKRNRKKSLPLQKFIEWLIHYVLISYPEKVH